MNKQRIKASVLVATMCAAAFAGFIKPAFFAAPVSAKPAYMDRYNQDSFARNDLRGRCTVCHIGHGGGERNDFGEAFEDTGYRITPQLRSRFPQLFEPASK